MLRQRRSISRWWKTENRRSWKENLQIGIIPIPAPVPSDSSSINRVHTVSAYVCKGTNNTYSRCECKWNRGHTCRRLRMENWWISKARSSQYEDKRISAQERTINGWDSVLLQNETPKNQDQGTFRSHAKSFIKRVQWWVSKTTKDTAYEELFCYENSWPRHARVPAWKKRRWTSVKGIQLRITRQPIGTGNRIVVS